MVIYGCAKTNVQSDTTEAATTVPEESKTTIQSETEESVTETEPSYESISTETAVSTYEYFLETLDITLEIPENMYVYKTDGVYKDWTGNVNVHDFCEWTIVTDQEYDEAELAGRLKENYAEEAEHIVYVVAVTPKEMFPVRRLCGSVYPVSGSVRIAGDYYVETLYMNSVVVVEDGYVGTYKKNEFVTVSKERDALTEKWGECIEQNTVPTVNLLTYSDAFLSPAIAVDEPYEKTLVNDEFWNIYCMAVAELSSAPEKYAYDEAVSAPFIEKLETLAQSLKDSSELHRNEALLKVYTDPGEDIYLRAYYYAQAMMSYCEQYENALQEFPLGNIVVILQDWENGQRSFNVYINQGSSWWELGAGSDYMTDLSEAYEYVHSY